MDDRMNVTGGANPQAFDTQGFENSQTSQATPAIDPTIDRLGRLEQQISAITAENAQLKRQMQSQGDKLAAQLEKRFNANARALKKAAEIEGWDDETYQEKLMHANQKELGKLGTRELKTLQQPAEEEADEQPVFKPTPEPTNPAPTMQDYQAQVFAYQQQITNYVESLGLQKGDFTQTEWNNLVLLGPTQEGVRAITRAASKKLDEKESLAQQAAQHIQREGFAQEVKAELEQTGGLGGANYSAGQNAGTNQIQRLLDQEIKKYQGTGRLADVLMAQRELEQRYRK